MGFEVYQGHKVQVVAHGPDAAQAVTEIAEALGEGWGRRASSPSRRPRATSFPLLPRPR